MATFTKSLLAVAALLCLIEFVGPESPFAQTRTSGGGRSNPAAADKVRFAGQNQTPTCFLIASAIFCDHFPKTFASRPSMSNRALDSVPE